MPRLEQWCPIRSVLPCINEDESTHIALVHCTQLDWIPTWQLDRADVSQSIGIPHCSCAVLRNQPGVLVALSEFTLTSHPVTTKLHALLFATHVILPM